jgi:hypothetical protein
VNIYLRIKTYNIIYGAKRHFIYTNSNYTRNNCILPNHMATTINNYNYTSLSHIFIFKRILRKQILKN